MQKRLPIIDTIRGLAILLMIAYHTVFDLHTIFDLELNPYSGFWFYEGRLSAILFILISGVSTSLLFINSTNKQHFHNKNLKRTLIILFWAMVITLATHFANPQMTIHFGILHLLAISTLLSTILVRLPPYILSTCGILALVFSSYLLGIISQLQTATTIQSSPSYVSDFSFLIFGIHTESYSTWDYYPLLPWFGLILIGLAIGKWIPKISLTKKTTKSFMRPPSSPPKLWRVLRSFGRKKDEKNERWVRGLGDIGQNSLTIYLLHQPIILAILFLTNKLAEIAPDTFLR